MIHVIKYETSKDGEYWDKHGLAIPYELGVAEVFSGQRCGGYFRLPYVVFILLWYWGEISYRICT